MTQLIPDLILQWLLSLLPISLFISGWVVLLGFANWACKNPEKLEKWGAILSGLLSGLGSRFERAAVAKDVQADIRGFAKKLNSEVEDAVPHGIKIDWVTDEDAESFVDKGTVVILLRHHRNKARNLVKATAAYVSKGVIPDAREYVDPAVLESIDMTIAKKILLLQEEGGVLQTFYHEILDPKLKEQPGLRELLATMERLDNHGLFGRFLLFELLELGRRLHPALPEKDVLRETAAFVGYLNGLSKRGRGEQTELEFPGRTIRLGTVLVADIEKCLAYGTTPYLEAISHMIRDGFHHAYVLARGAFNVSFAGKIAKDSERLQHTKMLAAHEYDVITSQEPLRVACLVLNLHPPLP